MSVDWSALLLIGRQRWVSPFIESSKLFLVDGAMRSDVRFGP